MSRGAGEFLQAALDHHQAGRLDEAEALYRLTLDTAPGQPDALHLLGILRHQQGDGPGAIDYLGQAVAADGESSHYRLALAEALQGAGRLADAVEHYRAALRQETNPDIHFRLGAVLGELDRRDEALAA